MMLVVKFIHEGYFCKCLYILLNKKQLTLTDFLNMCEIG